MPLSPAALSMVRQHAARLAKRIESAGLKSSTLDAFMAELSSASPDMPDRTLTELQNHAAQIEQVLYYGDAIQLAETDLARIRYLLTGADPRTLDPAAVIAADIAANIPSNRPTYYPGADPRKLFSR